MKSILLAFIALASAAVAAAPVITVDLYGNVFQDGQNTNQQIGGFARENPLLAPQIDAAVRQTAIDGRAYIAAQVAAKEAEKAAAIAAAQKASSDAIAANADALKTAQDSVAALTQTLAARDSTIATSGAYITALQKKIRDLGGVPPSP